MVDDQQNRFCAAVICLSLGLLTCGRVSAEIFIVQNGRPNAEIVMADRPPRMAAMAALELQYYIQKISGARLPIVTRPGEDLPVKVYVGTSAHTDGLGVADRGLKYGAFRMVSGPSHLVLLGRDADYAPQEPWARKHNDRPRARAEWDKMTQRIAGRTWGHLYSSTFKAWWNPREYDRIMTNRYGAENKAVWDPRDLKWSREYQGPGPGAGFWLHDEGGSLNAVYAFLRTLGVRWYMSGDLGEVVPERKTIALPSVNKTVRPDSAVRSYSWYNYGAFAFKDVMWARRIGINSGRGVFGDSGGHGHVKVHGRKEMKEAHPEYYALVGGKRDTTHRGYGTACYSSEGLARETVKFARFLFDHLGQPHISIWPGDGFRKCGCESCRDQAPSELVWSFVDRVARELQKSHPDRLVSCGAYTPYIYPPESVDKFTPNVVVFIANCGRPRFNNTAWWDSYWQRVEGWRRKLAPGRIMRNENNRYSLHGNPGGNKPILFPAIHPRSMAKDIHALKGVSMGERCEESQSKARWVAPGCDHLNLCVQARFLWDAEQDLDALLDEYYALFYGPARDEMKAAFAFAEANFPDAKKDDLRARVRFLEMLHSARRAAGDGVYGKRVQLIIDELQPLEEAREALKHQAEAGDPRENNPAAIAYGARRKKAPKAYRLKDLVTGKRPDVETTFTVVWDRDALVFDIRCREPDMENLYVTADVWGGDSVAILLESPSHSYYQIEVNPDGKVFDADRQGKMNPRWESMAEVKTERGKDFWRVEVRIPIALEGKEGAAMDPFHYVVGPKPDGKRPWYFNVGRARVRERKKTAYSFCPTGARTYHDPKKFAKLIVRH